MSDTHHHKEDPLTDAENEQVEKAAQALVAVVQRQVRALPKRIQRLVAETVGYSITCAVIDAAPCQGCAISHQVAGVLQHGIDSGFIESPRRSGRMSITVDVNPASAPAGRMH